MNDLLRYSFASRSRPRFRSDKRAFTLVEMLIVIAVIILLLSLLIVGLNVATKTAQGASTRSLMQAIKQGLVRFEGDVGYLPPVLGVRNVSGPDDLRALWAPPDLTNSSYNADIQPWRSATTFAEYLLGYGHRDQDGYGFNPDNPLGGPKEIPLLGIRHPGSDGVWSASYAGGALADRMPSVPEEIGSSGASGTIYGPYIELANDRLVASTDGTFDADGKLELFFPGENGYDATHPKVIVDYWGEPLMYYRRPYLALGQSYRAGIEYTGTPSVDERGIPTLADVIALRPFKVSPGGASDVHVYFADDAADTTVSITLRAAEFAVFSSGPDRFADLTVRVDFADLNRDNIVETGP